MKRSFDLIGSIREHLAEAGFRQLPLKKEASALFFKPASGLFLTLGVEVSRRYRETFTGSFYLAPTFSWAYAPPNEFPLKGYRRIGECLTPSQRKQVEPDATAQQTDVWWHGFTPENAEQFAHFVTIAESKFLNTKGLVQSVKKSTAMRELLEQIAAVQQTYRQKTVANSPLVEKVRKEKTVPAKWYAAAAKVASERFQDYDHKDGIKMLAEESWLLSEFG